MIGFWIAGEQRLNRRNEIICNCAAKAPICELNDIFLTAVLVSAGLQNFSIDPNIAKLVDD